jgi:hypothetical protein
MPFQPKLSKEERQQVLEWAKEGHGYVDIVKLLNNRVSKQCIKQMCQRAGIDAFAIKQEKTATALQEKMTAKWGKDWLNKEHRRAYIYQSMREKFRHKKANATRDGIDWDLDFGDLEFPTHCPVLGMELDYFNTTPKDNSPSFDRVDPNKGYVKGNVMIISKKANTIKSNGSAEDHLRIAEYIKKYM